MVMQIPPIPRPSLDITVAQGFWSRLRGWMFRRTVADGESLLLMHCNGVHTCWMRFAIDVVFLDADGRVLGMKTHVSPFRATWRLGAHHVLEMPAGAAHRHGLAIGGLLPMPFMRG